MRALRTRDRGSVTKRNDDTVADRERLDPSLGCIDLSSLKDHIRFARLSDRKTRGKRSRNRKSNLFHCALSIDDLTVDDHGANLDVVNIRSPES